MSKNYKHFEDTDENKLIYTTIHKDYVRYARSTHSTSKLASAQLVQYNLSRQI